MVDEGTRGVREEEEEVGVKEEGWDVVGGKVVLAVVCGVLVEMH